MPTLSPIQHILSKPSCVFTFCILCAHTLSSAQWGWMQLHQGWEGVGLSALPLHNVHFVKYVFLPTEQAETNICWIIYQDATFKICLSLFGWKENILDKMHIVHWTRWRYRSSLHLPLQSPTSQWNTNCSYTIQSFTSTVTTLFSRWKSGRSTRGQLWAATSALKSCRDEWARCPFRPLQHSPWLQFPFLRENECCSKGFLFFPKRKDIFRTFL